jgi:uncharacterized membrane-anchored protein
MENLLNSLFDLFASLWAALVAAGGVVVYLFLALFGLLWAFFIRFYIAYRMAKNRNRDVVAWSLLSIFVSPILTWILLLILGDKR